MSMSYWKIVRIAECVPSSHGQKSVAVQRLKAQCAWFFSRAVKILGKMQSKRALINFPVVFNQKDWATVSKLYAPKIQTHVWSRNG